MPGYHRGKITQCCRTWKEGELAWEASKEVLLDLCLEGLLQFQSQGGPEHRSRRLLRGSGRKRVDMWSDQSEEGLVCPNGGLGLSVVCQQGGV